MVFWSLIIINNRFYIIDWFIDWYIVIESCVWVYVLFLNFDFYFSLKECVFKLLWLNYYLDLFISF